MINDTLSKNYHYIATHINFPWNKCLTYGEFKIAAFGTNWWVESRAVDFTGSLTG